MTGSGATASTDWKSRIFLILILLTLVLEFITGFSHIPLAGWLVWYAAIALAAAPLLLDSDGFVGAISSRRIGIYAVLSAFSFLLPHLLGWLARIDMLARVIERADGFIFLLLVFGFPWLVYTLFASSDHFVLIVRGLWFIILIGLVIVAALFSIAQTGLQQTDLPAAVNINPRESFGDMVFWVREGVGRVLKSVSGVPESVGIFLQRNLNDSLGEQYMGQVDPHASRDLGVRFTRVWSASTRFMEGGEVIVRADIQGESFRDTISLNVRCYALDGKDNLYEGDLTLPGSRGQDNEVLIRMREKVTATCTLTDLPKGRYEIWFAGTFNFKTWGYVQYYFAPDALVKDAWSQDIDPAVDAGIPKRPIAIYTNGPIQLGLASEYDQPIGVNIDDPDRLPYFGASINNAWSGTGEVTSVRYISLLVPPPFTLQQCDRFDVDGNKESLQFGIDPDTGYREYTFGSIDNPNAFFESVTCYLSFEGATEPAKSSTAEQFISGFDLVMKTFAAKTDYLYSIKDYASVEVE